MSKMLATLQIQSDEFKFSSGHFTLFSATERERLHGHTFTVKAEFTAPIQDDGLTFDYQQVKPLLKSLCSQLHEALLLPAHSPYLTLEETDDYIVAHFNQTKMPFLKSDVVVLPIRNISDEELARWFVEQLKQDEALIKRYSVERISISVFTRPGIGATTTWGQADD